MLSSVSATRLAMSSPKRTFGVRSSLRTSGECLRGPQGLPGNPKSLATLAYNAQTSVQGLFHVLKLKECRRNVYRRRLQADIRPLRARTREGKSLEPRYNGDIIGTIRQRRPACRFMTTSVRL